MDWPIGLLEAGWPGVRAAAMAPSSKSASSAKELMRKAGVPTRPTAPTSGSRPWKWSRSHAAALSSKADELAPARGHRGRQAWRRPGRPLRTFLMARFHQPALVLEERLSAEVSLFALTDAARWCCSAAQDHKRIGEGDTVQTPAAGPYAPAPLAPMRWPGEGASAGASAHHWGLRARARLSRRPSMPGDATPDGLKVNRSSIAVSRP